MNLPNKLSLFRIILFSIIAWIYLYVDLGSVDVVLGNVTITYRFSSLIVFVLFIVASITDYLDGKIARSRNLITSFGKFIDPIADKLLVNTMFILFALNNLVPIILVLCMIWRDMVVDGLRMSASSKGNVVAANGLGKLKTVLQMSAISVLLLNNWPFIYIGIPFDQILFWMAAIVSIISGIDYFLKLRNVVMETM